MNPLVLFGEGLGEHVSCLLSGRHLIAESVHHHTAAATNPKLTL